MKLTTKASAWMLLLLAILVVNSLLGFDALRELRRTDTIVQQDYETTLKVRRARTLLFGYHYYGLAASVQVNARDRANRDAYETELRNLLASGLSTEAEPALQKDFERLQSQVTQLLSIDPEPRREGAQRVIPFLEPSYRELYGAAFENLERIVNASSETVARERERDEKYYRENVRLNTVVLLISVLLVAIGIYLFMKRIVGPIQATINMVEEMRRGNLATKWPYSSSDETGRMGETLAMMAHELDVSRRSRIEFIGSVAHDLKNPLSSISLTCELALKQSERLTSATSLDLFARVKSQADRLRRLTEDLLEATKEGKPLWHIRAEEFSLESLARQSLEMARSTDSEHEYSLLIEDPPGAIQADRDRIEQVLINLLSNAAKYSPAGTRIELAAGSIHDQVFLEVRDQGVGVPDEKKNSVFEAFSRLESGKSMAEGAGLGLAIVKDIVTAHGGSITIHDRSGGGSIFRVVLPRSIPKSVAETQAAA